MKTTTKLTKKHFHAAACIITSLICVYHIICAALVIDPTHVINGIFSGMLSYIFYQRWRIVTLHEAIDEVNKYLDEAIAKTEAKVKANNDNNG